MLSSRPLPAAVLLLLAPLLIGTGGIRNAQGAQGLSPVPITGLKVIEQPGYYVVAGDLTVFQGPVIEIRSNDVILDLAGRRITVRGPGDAIATDGRSTRIRVTNGTVVGGRHGIHLARQTGRGRFQVDNVTLLGQRDGGIVLSAGDLNPGRAVVRDATVRDAGGAGIVLSHFDRSSIRDNLVTGSRTGIFVTGSRRTKISRNVLSLNDTGVYASFSEGLKIRGNRSDSNRTHGIHLQDVFSSRVQHNETVFNGGSGLFLGTAQENRVRKNACMNNTLDGLTLEAGSFRNDIRANVLESNDGCGVRIACTSTGNVFNRNRADRNGSGAVCEPVFPCLVAP